MSKINIEMNAGWEIVTNIFGSHQLPLTLVANLTNNTNNRIKINKIFVSIKHNFLLFETSKEILWLDNPFILNATDVAKCEFNLNSILKEYNQNKKFTIRILFNENEIIESEKVSIKILNDTVVNSIS